MLKRHRPGVRLGGAWIFMVGPKRRRATATVHSSSVKGGLGRGSHWRVPFLGTKFWMMSSCQHPSRPCQITATEGLQPSEPRCLRHAA